VYLQRKGDALRSSCVTNNPNPNRLRKVLAENIKKYRKNFGYSQENSLKRLGYQHRL